MTKSTTGYTMRFLILVVSLIFMATGLDVSAQNSNSSTTATPGDASMQNTNTSNMNGGARRSGRRGRRRRGGRTINTNGAAMSVTLAPGDEFVTDRPLQMPAQTGRCDPMTQEQTDLSGTYTGAVNYAEGGLSGDATLTINGNSFTMTSGSGTQEGRVVAVTTCNYTAVTMMFGKEQMSASMGQQLSALTVVSLRAKRIGGGLMLESAEGETRQFSFSPAIVRAGVKTPRRVRSGKPIGAPIPVGIKPPTARNHAR